jgi:hypothetical protein
MPLFEIFGAHRNGCLSPFSDISALRLMLMSPVTKKTRFFRAISVWNEMLLSPAGVILALWRSLTRPTPKSPLDRGIREQARGVTTVMLIPQSLDTQWYERAAECANETVILSGGRVAFVEPDVELGLVEVNINPGGSMLLIFRGYCQEAGHTISKIPLAVMKKLGGYDPANVVRKKRPRKKAA